MYKFIITIFFIIFINATNCRTQQFFVNTDICDITTYNYKYVYNEFTPSIYDFQIATILIGVGIKDTFKNNKISYSNSLAFETISEKRIYDPKINSKIITNLKTYHVAYNPIIYYKIRKVNFGLNYIVNYRIASNNYNTENLKLYGLYSDKLLISKFSHRIGIIAEYPIYKRINFHIALNWGLNNYSLNKNLNLKYNSVNIGLSYPIVTLKKKLKK